MGKLKQLLIEEEYMNRYDNGYYNDSYYEPEDEDFDEELIEERIYNMVEDPDGEFYWKKDSQWYEGLSETGHNGTVFEEIPFNLAPQDIKDKVLNYWRDVARGYADGD
jgi:hypothetical protein